MIDVDGEPFQLGRRLYEAQVLYARIKAGEKVEPEDVAQLCRNYCELINWVGILREEYRSLIQKKVAE